MVQESRTKDYVEFKTWFAINTTQKETYLALHPMVFGNLSCQQKSEVRIDL